MKNLTRFLLLAVLLSAKYASAQKCLVDSVIDLKIQESISLKVASELEKAQLVCRDVKYQGTVATCPSGFKPTGCACGMGCGSWDIRSDTTCHCQCMGMDWTAARCCKVALQR